MQHKFRIRQSILIRLVRLWVITCCFLAIIPEVQATHHDTSIVGSEAKTEDDSIHERFIIPASTTDVFDWIQLTSGEWLKGELKVLYDRELEFDSDELDLLKLDWEDVKYVKGSRKFSVRFEGPFTVNGFLEVTEDKVFVDDGKNKLEFDRSKLVAIAAGEPKEINYWSGKITFGLNLSSGNTDQIQWSTIANIKRRTSGNRFVADYLGNFAETEGQQTVNNQRLNAYFDILKTRNYFIRAISGEFFRDPFSNISSRVTVGAGMGYHIIDTSVTEWDVTGGLAYQRTRFDSVEAGESESASTPALVLGTKFNTELTKKIDFNLRYDIQIVNQESGTYNHHFIGTFENEITSWLDVDISFVWDRIQDPQPNADGTVPEQNDYYLILGLGIDF